jgi:uncharacterized membrane protein
MKKCIITGLVILLPIALTILILAFLIDILTAPFLGIVHIVLTFLGSNLLYLQHHTTILLLISRLIVLVFLFLVILVLGYLGNKFFFKFLINTFHRVMMKIPIIKKIYKIVRDITKTFFSDKGSVFESSVIVNFPFPNSYMMGFQTNHVPQAVKEKVPALQEEGKTVFLPTALHPTCGFLVMMSPHKIHQTSLTTEEVLKFLISVGLFVPEDTKEIKKGADPLP